ncbi:molybdopterin molybdotransferase [Candidatus Electrothrix aarhusensis]|jgi:molybdopterin molybdotransferase|uniref:Molybdopterin molybdenumtransferase n=1 Tax=Candidatus Electrothrix aarhusensis TaxID=1859131 RepID=A0A3S3QJZ9_9BACT|nr:molybdopterin molybdotransferase [Candidatus Electrothrix aarhusensis]
MKNNSSTLAYSLQEAHTAIAAKLSPLAQEQVPLAQTLGRINAVSIFADHPKPSYAQSTRDGFALAEQPHSVVEGSAEFQLSGEIAAGCIEQQQVQAGQAYRIMTGAMVPCGTVRVVPFEICREKEARLSVPREELDRKELFIRPQGKDIKQGQRLVTAGTRLCPNHLLMLAENGSQEIWVHRHPRVAVICTGSELVKSGEALHLGQKISSNGVLLAAILQQEHCLLVRSVTVGDDTDMIMTRIQQILAQDKPDLMISTGGMGPGKFDLMEQVVTRLGGKPVYNRLKVRPGKATLFALIDNTPLFALPGPPPAVRLLFHELVVPGLHRLQGLLKNDIISTELVDAILTEPMGIRRTGHLVLKSAVATLCNGRLQVRPAGKLEQMNAIIHLVCEADGKAGRGEVEKNQLVKMRLVGPLVASNHYTT